jgi:hypothetical protein
MRVAPIALPPRISDHLSGIRCDFRPSCDASD